jgi:hypothetical protein
MGYREAHQKRILALVRKRTQHEKYAEKLRRQIVFESAVFEACDKIRDSVEKDIWDHMVSKYAKSKPGIDSH